MVEWLLEEENPSVRYQTMVELLDRKEDDGEVRRTREKIAPGTGGVAEHTRGQLLPELFLLLLWIIRRGSESTGA